MNALTTDNERRVSNGGADAKQQKDASEVKEVDAANKPAESNGPESILKKSPACKIAFHTYILLYGQPYFKLYINQWNLYLFDVILTNIPWPYFWIPSKCFWSGF